MKTTTLVIATVLSLIASASFAQPTQFLAVPAAAFTPQNATTVENPLRGTVETLGYSGNFSGTARFFGDNGVMFAPVYLPHGATVIAMECAGAAPRLSRRIAFKLRRNHPQQANLDIAAVFTDFPVTSFQFKTTTRILAPVIDNRLFNYYLVAEIEATNDIKECRTCWVNRCSIAYALP